MNLNLFIAKKISKKKLSAGDEQLSRTSNVIVEASIAVSVLVMLIALYVTSGFRAEVMEKASAFSGDFVLSYPGAELAADQYLIESEPSYLHLLENIEGVRNVSPVSYRPGMIKTDDVVQGLLFKGVDSNYVFDFFSENLTRGGLPDFSTKGLSNDILVSESLARMLSLDVGDQVTAYFVGENVRYRKFTVTGMYDVSLEDIDKRLVFVDLRHIQRLNSAGTDKVSGLEIYLDAGMSDASRTSVSDEIDRIVMDESTDDDIPVVSRSVSDLYPELFDWLGLLDYNVLVILVLMAVVSGINMVSGLLIILFEKISMIGILRSMGMRSSGVANVFVCRGLLLVSKGMLAGNILALAFYFIQKYFHIIKLDPENYFVSYVPVDMSLGMFLTFNAVSLVLMVAVMMIPAYLFSRTSPDKTIRLK